MSWRMRKVDAEKMPKEIGDVWAIPLSRRYPDTTWDDGTVTPGETFEEVWGDRLSPQFRASGRGFVVFVTLPDKTDWCVDLISTATGQGWDVDIPDGDLERLTVRPSVNIVGYYHGFLWNGVVGSDLEGRVYPEVKTTGFSTVESDYQRLRSLNDELAKGKGDA